MDQIWRICAWGNLFDELQADRILRQIKQTINNPKRSARTQLQGRIKKNNPKLPQSDQEGLALLIVGLIQQDPNLRSSAKDLQNDTWLYDNNSWRGTFLESEMLCMLQITIDVTFSKYCWTLRAMLLHNLNEGTSSSPSESGFNLPKHWLFNH